MVVEWYGGFSLVEVVAATMVVVVVIVVVKGNEMEGEGDEWMVRVMIKWKLRVMK